MGKDKDLRAKIVPNNKLETTSKEIVGFNIYNPSSYVDSGVGHGSSFTPILKAGQEGKFILHYDLGVNEETPQVPLMVPSAEKLRILEDGALDATLIMMLGDNEIARFTLNKEKQ